MRIQMSLTALAAAVLLNTIGPSASAQFGFPGLMQLPADDFTWIWGTRRERIGRGSDFSILGGEGGFRCELDGRLSPSSSWSTSEIRRFENDLRGSLGFIQEAANAMYIMDQQRQLDWARLDCARPEDPAEDPERAQELEDKARAKAERRRERRRARAASEADD